jgi:hypothetical protein
LLIGAAAGAGVGVQTGWVAAATVAGVPPFRIKIEAATHTPKANAKWPVTIVATSRSGKPVAGRLTMRILVGGTQVGTVDKGHIYRFVGSWHEKSGHEITWPAAAVGEPVVFQAVVTVHGITRKANYTISVRA